jgi:hypothetical protein
VKGAVIRRWSREPLLHFFALGAVLFGVYGAINSGSPPTADEIVVSRGQLQSLELQFERVWQRPATSTERQALIDNWVREEIFYREGVTLGLDRDDPVVRRRIGQKLEFIVESAAPAPATDAELQAWLDSHPGRYRIEPTYSLRQIYFDPARHRADLHDVIAVAKRALAAHREITGDATMLPPGLDAVTPAEAERVFGVEFVDGLKSLPVGGWQGPVTSAFGVHLVALTRHDPARPATLAEARADVERDLALARLQQANAAFYDKLRAKYAIRIESAGVSPEPG